MRWAGWSWNEIGSAIGVSRFTVIERGRRLNAARAPDDPTSPVALRDDGATSALRAGHPITWGAITAGTTLDGAPYDGAPSHLGSRWT
jgi:hypothetical protein